MKVFIIFLFFLSGNISFAAEKNKYFFCDNEEWYPILDELKKRITEINSKSEEIINCIDKAKDKIKDKKDYYEILSKECPDFEILSNLISYRKGISPALRYSNLDERLYALFADSFTICNYPEEDICSFLYKSLKNQRSEKILLGVSPIDLPYCFADCLNIWEEDKMKNLNERIFQLPFNIFEVFAIGLEDEEKAREILKILPESKSPPFRYQIESLWSLSKEENEYSFKIFEDEIKKGEEYWALFFHFFYVKENYFKKHYDSPLLKKLALKGIESSSPTVRGKAAMFLQRHLTKEDIPEIEKILENPDPDIQFEATRLLLHYGSLKHWNLIWNLREKLSKRGIFEEIPLKVILEISNLQKKEKSKYIKIILKEFKRLLPSSKDEKVQYELRFLANCLYYFKDNLDVQGLFKGILNTEIFKITLPYSLSIISKNPYPELIRWVKDQLKEKPLMFDYFMEILIKENINWIFIIPIQKEKYLEALYLFQKLEKSKDNIDYPNLFNALTTPYSKSWIRIGWEKLKERERKDKLDSLWKNIKKMNLEKMSIKQLADLFEGIFLSCNILRENPPQLIYPKKTLPLPIAIKPEEKREIMEEIFYAIEIAKNDYSYEEWQGKNNYNCIDIDDDVQPHPPKNFLCKLCEKERKDLYISFAFYPNIKKDICTLQELNIVVEIKDESVQKDLENLLIKYFGNNFSSYQENSIKWEKDGEKIIYTKNKDKSIFNLSRNPLLLMENIRVPSKFIYPGLEKDEKIFWLEKATKELNFNWNNVFNILNSNDSQKRFEFILNSIEEWKKIPKNSPIYPLYSYWIEGIVGIEGIQSFEDKDWKIKREKLEKYGFEFECMYGACEIKRKLLNEIALNFQKNFWGRRAFAEMSRWGWTIGDCCLIESREPVFTKVIEYGEKFLKENPESEIEKEILLDLALAYDSW